jgi:hypothetical protein
MIVHMKSIRLRLFILLVFALTGCTASTTPDASTLPAVPVQTLAQEDIPMKNSVAANVLSVTVTGEPGKYQFDVEVSSPDTGCDQYADWWEVLTENGKLLYRRVLLHSHVDEQPFTRSGGPVPIDENTIVLVRAHMNTNGYGGQVLKGSLADGFQSADVTDGFAAEVESMLPLPDGCAF